MLLEFKDKRGQFLVALMLLLKLSLTASTVSLPADFLNLLLLQRGQQPSDPCYDEFDKAKYCKPDFVNAALGRPVVASSECGTKSRGPETFCRLSTSPQQPADIGFVNEKIGEHEREYDTPTTSSSSPINRSCYLCDERHLRTSHSANLVTDVNDPRNATCWVSSLLPYDSTGSSNASVGNVTLTLSLGKRFEITYVSVTFCQEEPTAFSIWKSDDFGVTWQPFRKYARDCQQSYNVVAGETIPGYQTLVRKTTTTTTTTAVPLISGRHTRRQTRRMSGLDIPTSNIKVESIDDDDGDFTSPTPGLTPTCIEEYGSSSGGALPMMGRPGVSLSESRVVFPTLELAPPSISLDDLDTSLELQDWVSATDLRIEFSRLPAHYSAASIAETRYFSVSDLAVGGRCKCNGHASKCVPVSAGSHRLQCECRHNTQGEDCGQCKPFFVDRPWRRATVDNPNECVACNCNLHARQCRFNEELWQLSGQKSGGVCVGCRHNTAGRNCQYCREGFFRDHTKPITHRRACKVCECHPVGSLGKTCNQTTGQCPCKEGVEGISCSRCAPGYQQTNSPVQPCVKIAEPVVPDVSDYQADDPYADVTPEPPVSRHYSYAVKHHQQRAHPVSVPSQNSCENVCGNQGKTPGPQAGPRLSFSKWCQSHLAALIQLEDGGRLRVGSWTRLTARLYRLFARNKREVDAEDFEQDVDGEDDIEGEEQMTLPSGDEISVWIQTRVLDCKCIRLKEGRKWLVTGRLGRVMAPAPPSGGRAGRSATPVAQFILDPTTSAVVRWRPELETRIKKFARMDRSGACQREQTDAPSTVPPTTVAVPQEEEDDRMGYQDDETVVDAQQHQQTGEDTTDDYNDDPAIVQDRETIQVVPSISRRSSPTSHPGNYGNHIRRHFYPTDSKKYPHMRSTNQGYKRRDRRFEH